MSIMAPRQQGDKLFAAGIGGAGVVLKLEKQKDETKVTPIWEEVAVKGRELIPKPRGVYPVNMTPFIENGIIYAVDQPGMLRAIELDTGKHLWFSFKPVIGKQEEEDFKGAGSGTAFVVKNGDRFFLFAETGELIIAKLSPKEYEEVSRVKLLDPTGAAFGRKVVWSHPAFANKCAYHPQRQGDHLRESGGGVRSADTTNRPVSTAILAVKVAKVAKVANFFGSPPREPVPSQFCRNY